MSCDFTYCGLWALSCDFRYCGLWALSCDFAPISCKVKPQTDLGSNPVLRLSLVFRRCGLLDLSCGLKFARVSWLTRHKTSSYLLT